MRTALAYLLTVFGLPIVVGQGLAMIVWLLVRSVLGNHSRLAGALGEVANGAFTIGAAWLLFHWLKVPFSWIPLAILLALASIWLRARGETSTVPLQWAGMVATYLALLIWV